MSTKPATPATSKPSTPAATSAAPATTTATTAIKKDKRTPEQIEKARQEFKSKNGYFPEDETPEQQFKRLGEPRVVKALNAIRQIKNLARLKPSQDRKDKVFNTLRDALKQCETAYDGTSPTKSDFTL